MRTLAICRLRDPGSQDLPKLQEQGSPTRASRVQDSRRLAADPPSVGLFHLEQL